MKWNEINLYFLTITTQSKKQIRQIKTREEGKNSESYIRVQMRADGI